MKSFKTALLSLVASLFLAGCSTKPLDPLESRLSAIPIQLPLSAGNASLRCNAMSNTRLGTGTIVDTEIVTEGEPLLGLFKRLLLKWKLPMLPAIDAPVDFCRVTAKLRPVPGSEITAEIWLPAAWNHKLLGNGGGGFNGGLTGASFLMPNQVKKGYASIVTDAGHKMSDSARFAYDNREQLIDFGYRANHVAAVFGKALVAAYYGEPAEHTYFQGGSNGGRDALMMALRFPDTFDAIIAGAPAAPWSRLLISFIWNQLALEQAPALADKIDHVQKAVIAQCDSIDGAKDGILQYPPDCPFDPASLACSGEAGPDCLTPEEVTALRKLYQGPRLSDGTQILPGLAVGGETRENWGPWHFGEDALQRQMSIEGFRWMVYGDPDWNIDDFNLEQDYPAAKKHMGPILDSDNPDIRPFIEKGGKLILHHGWNDAAIPPGSAIEYYQELQKIAGPAAEEQVRLYMVPAMGHGPTASAPTFYDMLDVMDRWVETGVAPDRIIATEYAPPAIFVVPEGAKTVRTRPLCPWPKIARYDGSGSIDDAANFRCQESD